jgi:hypothetical protein
MSCGRWKVLPPKETFHRGEATWKRFDLKKNLPRFAGGQHSLYVPLALRSASLLAALRGVLQV